MQQRRTFLKSLMAGTTLAFCGGMPNLANAATLNNNRLIVITTNGGWDSMGLVQAVGDPSYDATTKNVVPKANAHRLDGFFALHPNLVHIKKLYDQRQAAFVHAAGWNKLTRSHFDAFRLIENGDQTVGKLKGLQTGWLNRAAGVLAPNDPSIALSSSATPPFILKGNHPVGNIGRGLPGEKPSDNFRTLLGWQYAKEPYLKAAFDESLKTNQALQEIIRVTSGGQSQSTDDLLRTVQAQYSNNDERRAAMVGYSMAPANGYHIGQLKIGGWDHHKDVANNLTRRATILDNVLKALNETLGAAWNNTMVVVVSEFGRQIPPNGSNGRDHGTGQCLFLCGGAVKGGRVYLSGAWPGVGADQLVNSRNGNSGRRDGLRVTTDIRRVFIAGLMHVGLTMQEAQAVFPEAGGVSPMAIV